MNITIVGCGSWGLAIGTVLDTNGHSIKYYTPFKEEAQELSESRKSENFLPGVVFPDSWQFFHTPKRAFKDAELIIVASPSSAIRSVAKLLDSQDYLSKVYVLSLVKGIEQESLLRMSQILEKGISWLTHSRVAVLSGPSHAEEVAQEIPTSVAIAAYSARTAKKLQTVFFNESFRVYTSEDVVGVELSGALKNVIAISTGILDGLRLGDNTKGALLTRGLAEISRLGECMGGHVRTFAGLAGMGDLITTCTSQHSRNRYVGEEVGKGRKLSDVLEGMKMVAEGVPTTKSGYQLSQKYKVEMPITHAVYDILYNEREPAEALKDLMAREPKPEGL